MQNKTDNNRQAFFNSLIQGVLSSQKADLCRLVCVDGDAKLVTLIASTSDKDVLGISWPDNVGLFSVVIERCEPYFCHDMGEHIRYATIAGLVETPDSHVMMVPIMHAHQVIALITCYRQGKPFEENDLSAFMASLINDYAINRLIEMLTASSGIEGIEEGEQVLTGLPCSDGMVMGPILRLSAPVDFNEVPLQSCLNIQDEIDTLHRALAQVERDISGLQDLLSDHLSEEESMLFSAYCHMVDRHGLMSEVTDLIQTRHLAATSALKEVVGQYVARYQAMDDVYLRSRVVDLEDIARRVLGYLQADSQRSRVYPERFVLIADEITPMALTTIPMKQLVGMVLVRGSPYSHIGILARAMGIPTVMGVSSLRLSGLEGKRILVDGYTGQVVVRPSEARRETFKTRLEEERLFQEEMASLNDSYAQTQDHHRIDLFVNIGLGPDIKQALQVSAGGVGLFRSEISFMLRGAFPSEEEQVAMYRVLMKTFSPRPVFFRTLDVGGDKQLPYWPIEERNPQLGLRGIRMSLEMPQIFMTQLRSILKASVGYGVPYVVIPMVSHLHEARIVRELLDKAHQDLLGEGLEVQRPSLGLMVEVPAVLHQIEAFSEYVDFFSVGSNDLVQYLLAVDRDNDRVAHLYNYFNPVFLRILYRVVDQAKALNRGIGICGEMAGDPMAALLLVGMGFDSLSMSPKSLPRIRWVLQYFTLAQAQDLLDAAMDCRDADEVHLLLFESFEQLGLSHVVGHRAIAPESACVSA